MFVGRVVTVEATPTAILTGVPGRGSNTPGALIKNTDADTVFLGGPDVDTTDGYPLAAGEAFTVGDVGEGDDLYGIVASGTAAVSVLEVT